MRRALLLALALVLVLGRPSLADEKKIEVTASPKKAEVTVGEDIEVEVTVKNAGTAELDLPELTFDARSVSFELSCDGGKLAWDAQFHTDLPKSTMEPDPLTAIKRAKLKAGESWTKSFTIPAVAAGPWSITAVYGGLTDPEPRALGILANANRLVRVKDATARSVKVLPGPNGETEVVAKMATSLGTFTMRFFPKEALGSALNFVRVAKAGTYEGTRFFRNDASLQILQGGALDGNARFAWGIPREQNLKHRPLMIAMARATAPNSAGCQIYICYGALAQALDREDGYAVFAQVVKGKDVIETMASVKTRGGPQGGQEPSTPITIESCKVQLAPKE